MARTNRTNNILTQLQFFQAASWAKEHADELRDSTLETAANLISRGTDITITFRNARAVMEAAGIIREKRGKPADPTAALIILRDDMTFLAEMIRRCMVERGQVVPQRLEKLAGII